MLISVCSVLYKGNYVKILLDAVDVAKTAANSCAKSAGILAIRPPVSMQACLVDPKAKGEGLPSLAIL